MLKLKTKTIETFVNEATQKVISKFIDINITYDNEKIGYVELFVNLDEDGDETSAYVKSIEIDESYRNKGFGTAVLKQLAEEHTGIYICPDNEDAERLYKRIGEETKAPYELESETDEYGIMYFIA